MVSVKNRAISLWGEEGGGVAVYFVKLLLFFFQSNVWQKQVEHLAQQLEIQKSHILEASDYYFALDNSYFNNGFLLKYPQIIPFTLVYRSTVEYKYYKDINSDFCIFRIRMDVGRSWSSQNRVGR